MRVEWAMACRALRVEGVEASAEGLAIDTLTLGNLPAELELVVLARFSCAPDECGTPQDVECYLMGPALSSVESLHFQLQMDAGPDHPAGWEAKVFVPIIVRADVTQVGTYGLDIYISGRFRWQVPFRVLVASPGVSGQGQNGV